MRSNGKGLGFGIFLLTVGIVWLLSIANIVSWSTLNALFTLWPLILVAFGISFIFRNNRVVRTLSWLLLLAVVIGYGHFFPAAKPFIKYDLHFGDGRNVKTSMNSTSTTNATNATNATSTTNATSAKNVRVLLEKEQQNEKAELKFDYGAMKINVDSNTKALLEADINESLVTHSENLDGKTAEIKFEMKDKGYINLGSMGDLKNDFHLSKDVIWRLEMDTGAADGSLDLDGLKVERLKVDTGAATLRLDMGSYNTEMKIDSGASNINITLPADTGMKVEIDGGLNNTNLGKDGWTKKGKLYYSPDYDSRSYKIDAVIDNGFGNLTVENR